MNCNSFLFVVGSLVFILSTTINSKKLCDIRTWYLNIITDDIFNVELNEEQNALKYSIETLVLNSAENRESRMTECHVLHMYNDLLMEKFNYSPSKKIMTIEVEKKESNAVKSKENMQVNEENVKTTPGDVQKGNLETQDSGKPPYVEIITKELDIMHNKMINDVKYLKNNMTDAADTNATENNSNSFVTKSKQTEEIKFLDECDDKNCNQVSDSIDKHGSVKEHIDDNKNNIQYVTNNVLDDTDYTDLDDNVLEESESPFNTYQEVERTKQEIDREQPKSMSATRFIPVGVCWSSKCFMSDVFNFIEEESFNFESDNVAIQTLNTSQTSVVHEYCPLGSFCLDQCHYVLSISFCNLGYSTNITYSKTHNDKNLTEQPTLIDNDTIVVARMHDKESKTAEHLYGIPRKPQRSMMSELCPNDTFCSNKCYYVTSWNMCIKGYGYRENTTVSGGSYINDTSKNLKQVQNNDANNTKDTDYEFNEADTNMKILEKNDKLATESEILQSKHAVNYKQENLKDKTGLDDNQVFVGLELQQKLKETIADNTETTKLTTMVNLDDSIKGSQRKNSNILVKTVDNIDCPTKITFNEIQATLNLEFDKIIEQKTGGYYKKVQMLEVLIMKLENQLLLEMLNKQNHSSTITRLENHILKLENELLKIGNNYEKLKEEADSIRKRTSKYLQLDHFQLPQNPEISVKSVKTFAEIEQHQAKINELISILRNQTNVIKEMKEKYDMLEEQNRKLHQMVTNQTVFMTSVMLMVQSLSEQNAKSRQEIIQLQQQLSHAALNTNDASHGTPRKDTLVNDNIIKRLDSLSFDDHIYVRNIESSKEIDTAIKEIPQVSKYLVEDALKNWCMAENQSYAFCFYHSTLHSNCVPYRAMFWSTCVGNKTFDILNKQKIIDYPNVPHGQHPMRDGISDDEKHRIHAASGVDMTDNNYMKDVLDRTKDQLSKNIFLYDKGKTIEAEPHEKINERYKGESVDSKLNEKYFTSENMQPYVFKGTSSNVDDSEVNPKQNIILNSCTSTICNNEGKTVAEINEQKKETKIKPIEATVYMTNEYADSPESHTYNTQPEGQRIIKELSQANIQYDKTEDKTESNLDITLNNNSNGKEQMLGSTNKFISELEVNLEIDAKIALENKQVSNSDIGTKELTPLQITDKIVNIANVYTDKHLEQKYEGKLSDDTLKSSHAAYTAETSIKAAKNTERELYQTEVIGLQTNLNINNITTYKSEIDNHDEYKLTNVDNKEQVKDIQEDEDKNIVDKVSKNWNEQRHEVKISDDTLKSPHVANTADTSIKAAQTTERELNQVEATAIQTNLTLTNITTNTSEIDKHDEPKPINVDNKESVQDRKEDKDKRTVNTVKENSKEQKHEDKISDDSLKSPHVEKIADKTIKTAQNTEREVNQIEVTAKHANLIINKSEINKHDEHKLTNVVNKEPVKEIKEDEDKKIVDKVKGTRKVPKYLATGKQREPKDCYDHFMRGEKKDGVYKIKLEGSDETIQVFCDMKRGGWTLIQRRQDGSTNFFLTWRDYKKGFGGLYGEHWLGNDNIFYLTNQDQYKLRVDLLDWNNQWKYADFEYFIIDSEDEGYELHIDGYSGDAGDGLTKHDGHKFSTKDVDNDKVVKEFGGSCAARFQGAGWYYKCYSSNLNGKYYKGGRIPEKRYDGITWKPWTGANYSLKKVTMKIRPVSAN